MKKILFFPILSLLLLAGCQPKSGSLQIKDLRVEYSVNPIAIDTEKPRFSWKLSDSLRDIQQTEYMILVSSDKNRIAKADIWKSGWIKSSQNIFIDYNGSPLKSGESYYWKVKVKDNTGRIAISNEVSSFTMAKLNGSDWTADWIAKEADEKDMDKSGRPRSLMFRHDFEVKKEVANARFYVSGLGNYVLYLNGNKIGKDKLTPGWTEYKKRVQYQVYDASELIQKGENGVGILLGNMWWSSGLGWKGGAIYSNGPLVTIMQLEIEYSDGETEIITTDSGWKADYSPIVSNTIYHGESWDAGKETPGWNKAGFDDSNWQAVVTVNMDSIVLSAQTAPEIRVMDEISPVSVNEVKPGIFVFDMGLNIVGTEKINFQAKKGDTVKLRFAELLHEDGTVAQENLRSARATDMYIPAKDGDFTWEPEFTYHGYRYVQVEGLAAKPKKEDFTGLRFYSSSEETGYFSSSNKILNQVWANILNGQKGNMESVPTDCPQRDERLGWMGDAQMFAPTSCYNMNMAQFYAKWLRDITDSQHESGYVYDVNPAIVVSGPSKAGWGDAVVIVPWHIYNFYGDQKIIEDNYEGMKLWIEFMRQKAENYIYEWKDDPSQTWEGYGDWIAVERSPVEPISAAYYYYSTRLLANMAGIIGQKEDQENYNQLADNIATAFHEKFFDSESINYPGKTQAANILPYIFGLTPDEYKEKIVENIVNDVRLKGNHPTTGFLGTAYLLPILSDNNYHQTAFETAINEDYPSWGYMVNNGATSMWELWNSDTERPEGMNSRNHFALGSVGEWYFSHLAGIKFTKPGYKSSQIKPMPAEGLDWVKAFTGTPYGRISSEWKLTDNSFTLDVTIPCNTESEIIFPLSYIFSSEETGALKISESGNLIEAEKDSLPQGIKDIQFTENEVKIKVGSGKYSFNLSENE